MKLTAAHVKSLKAEGGRRREVPDEVVPGLWLVITPAGGRSWVVRYSHAGADRRYTIGKTKRVKLEKARARAREVLHLVGLGRDPQAEKMAAKHAPPPPPPSPTVAAVTLDAVEKLHIRPSTRREWRRLAKVEIAKARFASWPADKLTRQEIRTWARARAEGSPYTANRAFELLRRVYSWAVGEDILQGSPFIGLQKPAAEHRSDRVLSSIELRSLLDALDSLPGPYSDAVLLLLLTGARREMVLGGTRDELHDLKGDEPRWVIPGGPDGRSKSGEPHVIPLSAAAVVVLERRLEDIGSGTRLFPRTRLRRRGDEPKSDGMGWSGRYVRDLRTAVGRAWAGHMKMPLPMKKNAKGEDVVDEKAVRELIPRWTIHNLRHAIATHLREDLSVPAEVVSMLLGHTPEGPRVTRVYDRARLLPERRAALVALAAWYARLREPGMGRVLAGRF